MLRQSKDQKYLQTGTVVHLLGQCSPVMVYPKYVCSILFTRPSDTTRLLARLVRTRHPLGRGLPTHHSGPLEPVRRTVGSTVCACEKTSTDTDRCVSPPNRSCGSHMKFPDELGESNNLRSQRHHTASTSLTLDLT